MVTKTLVLASSSPRRQELIQSLRLPYRVIASDVDETVEAGMEPAAIVEQLSIRKAAAVAELLAPDERAGAIVIGSDTIVVCDGEVLGKPDSPAHAEMVLAKLQGRSHEVYSGVACIDAAGGHSVVAHRMTRVTMKPLSGKQISRYVATGEPLDKAGSYGIQGLGATIVERLDGDYFTVVGLPLSLLAEQLAQLGVDVL